MNPIRTSLLAAAALGIVSAGSFAASIPVNLVNSGFEDPNADQFIATNVADPATDAVNGFVLTEADLSGDAFSFYGTNFGGPDRNQQVTPDPTDNDGFLYLGNVSLATDPAVRPSAQAGDVFDLVFDARLEAGAPADEIPLTVAIEFFDASGTELGQSEVQFFQGRDSLAFAELSILDAVAPAGTASVGISLAATGGLTNPTTGEAGATVNVDDFQLSVTPIPEPATATAGLIGLGLLAARRRR
jgi:MYXO-CTERM domain-containing protein